jgi:hypothetical protein
VAFLDDQPELLLDHGLEKHGRLARQLGRNSARRGLGQSLGLEHVGDLGLRLGGAIADLFALVLDLRDVDLALALR